MPRAKVDPSVVAIRAFMALPVHEAGLLLKHLAAVHEGRLRKVANGEKVKAPKERTPKMVADPVTMKMKPVNPRPRTAKPLVKPLNEDPVNAG